MDDFRVKINAILEKSLTEGDLVLWNNVLAEVPDELLTGIYNFLEKKPESIGFLTSNLRKKATAIEAGDQKLWAETLEEDNAFIRGEKINASR